MRHHTQHTAAFLRYVRTYNTHLALVLMRTDHHYFPPSLRTLLPSPPPFPSHSSHTSFPLPLPTSLPPPPPPHTFPLQNMHELLLAEDLLRVTHHTRVAVAVGA